MFIHFKGNTLFRIFKMELYLYWQLCKNQKHAYSYLSTVKTLWLMDFKQRSHKLIQVTVGFFTAQIWNVWVWPWGPKKAKQSTSCALNSSDYILRFVLKGYTTVQELVHLRATQVRKTLNILFCEKPRQKQQMFSLNKTMYIFVWSISF